MIRQREVRWLELDGEWPSAPVRVKFESVDLGDGSDAVPAVRVGAPRPSSPYQQQAVSIGSNAPTEYLIRVSDLRELLRLADESLENPG